MFAAYAASLTPQGVNQSVDADLHKLVRAGQHDEAERQLLLLIDGAPPSPIKAAVLTTSAANLSFSGWPGALNRLTPSFEAQEQQYVAGLRQRALERAANADPSKPRKPWDSIPVYERTTAIGLDLSGHAVENLTNPDGSMSFEVAYYADQPFAFSTSSREQILAACARYPASWQGEFIAAESSLTVTGISHLMMALGPAWRQTTPIPTESAADRAIRVLAEWWSFVAIDRALAGEAARLSSPRPVPIVLGTHDFGPDIITVHRLTT